MPQHELPGIIIDAIDSNQRFDIESARTSEPSANRNILPLTGHHKNTMIPSNITREHILSAIETLEAEGVPVERKSTKFDLLYNNKRYPPKYVLSLANLNANNEILSHELFSGGEESNRFLTARDFQILPKGDETRPLRLYESYSREEVHDIFAPDAPFIPQRGTWGLHGIIPIPDRPNDFAFFVTFGQKTGKHTFDEGITDEGVLTWQSQPKQSLKDGQIQKFINHDELINSIYLFLRRRKGLKYAY